MWLVVRPLVPATLCHETSVVLAIPNLSHCPVTCRLIVTTSRGPATSLGYCACLVRVSNNDTEMRRLSGLDLLKSLTCALQCVVIPARLLAHLWSGVGAESAVPSLVRLQIGRAHV